jgi:hypothetical protein
MCLGSFRTDTLADLIKGNVTAVHNLWVKKKPLVHMRGFAGSVLLGVTSEENIYHGRYTLQR